MIITADDYGLCPEINKAICELFDKGVLNQTSFIANGDIFDESVAELSRRPMLEVAAHLNLTNGKPILPASSVESLIGPDGNFLGGKHFGVLLKIIFGGFKKAEILAEWRAQIIKLREAGLNVTCLNSHGDFHLHPKLHDIVVSLMSEFKIRKVRLVMSGGSSRARKLRRRSKKLLKKIKKKNLFTTYPKEILGVSKMGRLTKEDVLLFLNKNQKKDFEIMLHPTFGQNPYHKAWRYPIDLEREVMLDSEVVELIDEIKKKRDKRAGKTT